MILWFRDLLDRVDGMSLRERVMVLVALLGFIGLVWDTALMQPLDRVAKARAPQAASTRTDVARLNDAIVQLAAQQNADPDAPLLAERERAKARLAELDKQIGGLTRGLVAPQDMVEVLRQMLAHAAPLKLVSLKTLPAEPLTKDATPAMPAHIFRHGVQLELEGTYPDLVEFLHGLQQLPAQFYWEELELDVKEHPLIHVRITAHTLGNDDAWLGV